MFTVSRRNPITPGHDDDVQLVDGDSTELLVVLQQNVAHGCIVGAEKRNHESCAGVEYLDHVQGCVLNISAKDIYLHRKRLVGIYGKAKTKYYFLHLMFFCSRSNK